MKMKGNNRKKITKFKNAIKAIPEDQFGKDDLLSQDLVKRVGSLNIKKIKIKEKQNDQKI